MNSEALNWEKSVWRSAMKLTEFDYEVINEGYKTIAGVDEAGRGPLAGPVYAAAVIMDYTNIIPEVNDSKKLTEKKREELFDIIIENAISYSISSVDEKRIDEINILNATMEAMENAINGLTVPFDLVLIDGNQNRGITKENRTVIKGDAKSYNIAAASILAKVSRDRYIREMAKLYPEYGFEKHKGYGTKAHMDILREIGPCEIHRKSFLKKL